MKTKVLGLAVLVLGVGLCLFTDLYLRQQHLHGVDVGSWNTTGSILIAVGIMMLLFGAGEHDAEVLALKRQLLAEKKKVAALRTKADADLDANVSDMLSQVQARTGSNPMQPLTLVTVAEAWNTLMPVGTRVRYWPGVPDGPGVESKTRTEAWTLGSGEAVVAVEGYSGGIALTHVVPMVMTDEER